MRPRELAIWEGEVFPVVNVGDVMVAMEVGEVTRYVRRSEVILLTEWLRDAGFTFWKGYDNDEQGSRDQPRGAEEEAGAGDLPHGA